MWDKSPIDDYVIDHVESLAEGKDQPIILNGVLIFEWVSGESIDDGLEENNNEIIAIKHPIETDDMVTNSYILTWEKLSFRKKLNSTIQYMVIMPITTMVYRCL